MTVGRSSLMYMDGIVLNSVAVFYSHKENRDIYFPFIILAHDTRKPEC